MKTETAIIRNGQVYQILIMSNLRSEHFAKLAIRLRLCVTIADDGDAAYGMSAHLTVCVRNSVASVGLAAAVLALTACQADAAILVHEVDVLGLGHLENSDFGLTHQQLICEDGESAQ
jgi:hypothetical protein